MPDTGLRWSRCSRSSTKGAAGADHPVPLLFVHGAWHAAWCWDEHFLGYFADRGYRAVALSFRGHGDSPASKPCGTCATPITSTTSTASPAACRCHRW